MSIASPRRAQPPPGPLAAALSDQSAAQGGKHDYKQRRHQDKPAHEERREEPAIEFKVHEPHHHQAELQRRKDNQDWDQNVLQSVDVVHGHFHRRYHGQSEAYLDVLRRARMGALPVDRSSPVLGGGALSGRLLNSSLLR